MYQVGPFLKGDRHLFPLCLYSVVTGRWSLLPSPDLQIKPAFASTKPTILKPPLSPPRPGCAFRSWILYCTRGRGGRVRDTEGGFAETIEFTVFFCCLIFVSAKLSAESIKLALLVHCLALICVSQDGRHFKMIVVPHCSRNEVGPPGVLKGNQEIVCLNLHEKPLRFNERR